MVHTPTHLPLNRSLVPISRIGSVLAGPSSPSSVSVLFAFPAMQILPFLPVGVLVLATLRLVSLFRRSFPLFLVPRRCDLVHQRPRLHGVQRAERASISFRETGAACVVPSYFTSEPAGERERREKRRERKGSVSSAPRWKRRIRVARV